MDVPPGARNLVMVERIERAPPRTPLRFVVAGDSGAWPDPTADGVYTQLLEQVAALDPPPAFLANLGDFAGPGTLARHEHYLRLVARLPVPDLCVVGNHDLDDPAGPETFERVHGPESFDFAAGHTRFVVPRSVPGEAGVVEITPETNDGPREQELTFLDERLRAAAEPHRVILMHMPPHLDGRYAPHADWGFERREREFLDLLREHRVSLVCCAHGLAFDTVVRDGVRFVMSGGGGSGLCSHLSGVCAQGPGRPEDRGALFHAVLLEVGEDGRVSGRVLQAFDTAGERSLAFG